MRLLAALLPLLAALPAAPACAGVLNDTQMTEVACNAERMQLFYYYLAPVKDENVRKDLAGHEMRCNPAVKNVIRMPEWLDASVEEMTGRRVWRDPEEGDITEAGVWQTPVSILYEYLTLTKKTFPPEKDGINIAPGLLVKEYADIRIRYQVSLDRLYRARTKELDKATGKPRDVVMGDSLGGRGRVLMAHFNLVLKQMESVADAISSQDSRRYAEAVTASAIICRDAFRVLHNPPRAYKPPPLESTFQKVLNTTLTVFGMMLMFLAVRLFFAEKDPGSGALAGDYAAIAAKYTEAFQRQFIRVNVKHLMLAPVVVLGLVGAVSLNIFIFFFMLAAGVMLGKRLPEMTLTMMKQMRGRKIDTQLMDGLILLSNCLRSGLDIVQGFEMVSKDLLPPISDEFGLVIKNYQLGMSFEKALGVMEERVDSKMLSYMIRAIVLQRQMGGNLTKVFERIVVDIREESKLDEKTKAMTAQQKIQSIVVGIMPWVMVGVMFMFQPETMIKFYSTPIGMFTAMFCVVWVGIGMKVVSSLGNIRV